MCVRVQNVEILPEQCEISEQFGYIFGPILDLCAKWNRA